MFKWMFLPLKRYAEFSGRSRRKEYWLFTLFTICGAYLVALPFFMLIGEAMREVSPYALEELLEEEPVAAAEVFRLFATILADVPTGALIASIAAIVLFWLAIIVPTLALNVRRFQDCNVAGKWFWLCFILSFVPLIGGFGSLAILIIAGFMPGTPGANRFGDNPREKSPILPSPMDERVPPPPAIWPAS